MRVSQMSKKIIKALAAVSLFFLAFFLSDTLGGNLYHWLEREQTEILFQYATDGQFSGNIYFSDDTNKRFGVPGGLPGIADDSSLSGIAEQLTKEQWEMAGVLEENTAYMEYLYGQGTSLSGLFTFSERLAGLQDGLTYACRYVLFLIWVIALHLLMRCPPRAVFRYGAALRPCHLHSAIRKAAVCCAHRFACPSYDSGRAGSASSGSYAYLLDF